MAVGFVYGSSYASPYYLGAGVSTAVESEIADVALGGHPYLINWKAETPLLHQPVPLTRTQADTSDNPSEATINPDSFWRRSQESWHLGAGQDQFDRKESTPLRFSSSFGVNVWDKWQLSLLNSTTAKTVSANNNQRLAVAGTHLYYTNGTALGYYTDIVAGSITNVTGVPGTAPSSIVSDGFNVWTAHGASGIYKTTRGAASTASHITGTVSLLGFSRGRVLAAQGRSVYDVTALAVGGGGALPGALFTQGNTDFAWVGFAEGAGNIYMAGYSGDKSLIYRTAVKTDGTALDAPVVAAELVDGEVVTSVYGYLGRFIFIGTDKGWRLGVVTSNGDLSIGVLVQTPQPVLCFEGQGKFVWFGWGNYATTETGLGRINTDDFVNINTLQPAYASDLMVHNQTANINSVVTFQNLRVLTVNSIGLYFEGTAKEPTGYVQTGKITYGMTEPKIGLWVNLQHLTTFGSYEVSMSANSGSFVSLGTQPGVNQPQSSYGVGELDAVTFELKISLTRDATDTTKSPILTNWLLRVEPRPEITNYIFCTLRMAEEQVDLIGANRAFDPYAEQDFIEDLQRTKQITTFQQGARQYSVIVEDFQITPQSLHQRQGGFNSMNADFFLKMKRTN